jgi:hypothetical protein
MMDPSSEEYKAMCCVFLGLDWMLWLLKFTCNLENGYWYGCDCDWTWSQINIEIHFDYFFNKRLFLHLLIAHIFQIFQEAFQKFIGQPVSVFCSSRTVWGHVLLQLLTVFLHFCCLAVESRHFSVCCCI